MSSKPERYLTYGLQSSLFLLALAAPLSIAATQFAWSLALLFWLLRLLFRRPQFRKEGIDLAVIAFVGLTLISSFFSYEPAVSLRKMVAVSLVTIVYLVSENIRDTKMLRGLIALILIGGAVAAVWAIGNFAVGHNLKVTKLAADSPLIAAGAEENDTILTANGKNVSSPEDLAAAGGEKLEIKVYRYEVIRDFSIPVASLSQTGDAAAKFGIVEWSRGRDIRAAGFFGHYTTYAENVQLILSLAFGLMIAFPGGVLGRNRMFIAALVAVLGAGLFLTVTRASWAGFLMSASVMILIGTTRRTIILCLVLAIPLAVVGLVYLQQKRNVAFIDSKDGSTTWRMTVWREAVGVLVSNPRHLAVGVGMDSIKTHWPDWHMFDNGNLPMGHMHSTPLEFAFERGIPTLIAWIVWMFFYLRMLWRGLKTGDLEWPERGLILGALGGTIGFLTCGFVHYNWGDSEIVMMFYLIMGLSLAVMRGNFQSAEQ